MLLSHALRQVLDLQVHDLADMLLGQVVEDDDLVNAVQQLGAEETLQLADDLVLEAVNGRHVSRATLARLEPDQATPARGLGVLRPQVRGHDDDRVAEVHGVTLAVGQAAVLQHLEQDVPDLRVRLLDFVEQDHLVRPAADRLGQLPALVVADVAGWGADEARHRVLLAELAHVHTHQRVVVVEQELG